MIEKPNKTYINELSGGDVEFENQIISIIKKEFPNEVIEYQNNLKSNKLLKTAESVHKLKHKISILGLEKGYVVAADFEKELKNEIFTLQNPFEEVLNKICSYLKTI